MCFTTLDLAMLYDQVKLHPDDREKTAFSTPFKRFHHTDIPFWLATATATFMRLIEIVVSEMLYSTLLAYLDDIIIFGRSFNEQLKRVDVAVKRFKTANSKLKPSKCMFGQRSVTFLGHNISEKKLALTLQSWIAYKKGRSQEIKEKCEAFSDAHYTTGSLLKNSLISQHL